MGGEDFFSILTERAEMLKEVLLFELKLLTVFRLVNKAQI